MSGANKLAAGGALGEAISLYKTWIDSHADDPLLPAVLFNYGVLLGDNRNDQAALHAYNEAIRLKPDLVPAHINLGSVLERLGAEDMALQFWGNALSLTGAANEVTLNYRLTAFKQRARLLTKLNRTAEAEEVLRLSLETNPNQREVIQHYVSSRQRLCRWPVINPVAGLTAPQMIKALAPLSMAIYTDDPMLNLASAYEYSCKEVGWAETFHDLEDYRGRPRAADGRLRIGYLSSDLRAHAIGYLTAEMLALHDRSKVEVFAFFCGFQAEDPIKARIRENVEHWFDINDLNDEQAASLIREKQIDILIDINGHTKDGRTRMLARRPAPVIVNWLGYAGTMGTPYHQYIIADDFIIPPELEKYCSEKVVRLPCYQPNDSLRVVADKVPTRTELGLPENAVVFCSFNGPQKISPFTFARWMDVLRQVDNSVLWLLCGQEVVAQRLREEATSQGIDPARLIFAPSMPNAMHLARYPLADLFLDSLPYGAHTTASDALWMGVPVITVPGRNFASRVCASLVRAAGMPELVCDSPESYVRLAVELGRDPARLLAVREKLRAQRDTCVLFDTPLFVREMEALCERLWQEWQDGQVPQPDLTNLDLYLEIGAALDHDSVEPSFLPDYEERYRAVLARRHSYSPIPYDKRLWPAPGPQ
ncbi:O-linked N-acetylglucosamine transferase [Niveispirillum sp. BGYR6]|uniref:O-linked N-acetylglucosamine transferase, SPINDLY family protein n=1 Tax=Niveispirillum sp. BGYR6 TaxID=2971249 RepID=UPI0022B99D81|nr:O-linked N-acetylglucosamine transferase [Niveispirillum sp. BGYR6]MDG5496410.1 O-linked N-acetylglucosamine transferase [Niveispirillum sp. BGYR6]